MAPIQRVFPGFALILCAALWTAALAAPPAAAQGDRLGTSGLSLPRRGLPVEVIDEFEDWRRVRDHDGTVGWVHRFMLVSRRTVLVMGATRTLRRKPEPDATGLAYLEAGVIADLTDCRKAWCRIEAQGFDGWLHRSEIFGTNADD
jgi:SH3-like domain-containing protein